LAGETFGGGGKGGKVARPTKQLSDPKKNHKVNNPIRAESREQRTQRTMHREQGEGRRRGGGVSKNLLTSTHMEKQETFVQRKGTKSDKKNKNIRRDNSRKQTRKRGGRRDATQEKPKPICVFFRGSDVGGIRKFFFVGGYNIV